MLEPVTIAMYVGLPTSTPFAYLHTYMHTYIHTWPSPVLYITLYSTYPAMGRPEEWLRSGSPCLFSPYCLWQSLSLHSH